MPTVNPAMEDAFKVLLLGGLCNLCYSFIMGFVLAALRKSGDGAGKYSICCCAA